MAQQEVSMCVKAFQVIAILLLTSYFLYQAYEIYMFRDRWTSHMYSSYGAFESWWNKQYKRLLMNEFAYTMPDQKELFPYKAKITVGFGYAFAFGSMLLLTGEKFASLIIMIAGGVYAAIIHGPMQAKT